MRSGATAKEIAEALRQSGATTRPTLTKGPSRVIADLLAHQVRAGKVLKTGPGTFAVSARPAASSVPSTARRSSRPPMPMGSTSLLSIA